MRFQFRFTDEQDVAAYGDGWFVWDEDDLARIRGRELVALEEQVDMPLFQIRRYLKAVGTGSSNTLATMAAIWIAMQRSGTDPGAWADFNPAVSLTTWELVATPPLASGEDPAPDSGSSTTPPPSPESVTS